MQLSPKMDNVWSPSLKWLFLNDCAWDVIKSFLLKDKPCTWDALLNPPLLANFLFRDNAGKVLGLRTRLAWGKLDNGPAASVRTWNQFQ